MRNTAYLPFFLIMIFLLGVSCHRRSTVPQSHSGYTLQKALHFSPAQRINLLAFDMLKKFDTTQNFVFSPYSISTGMAMAYVGSAGNTRRQMAATMNFHPRHNRFINEKNSLISTISRASGDTLLTSANGLWLQRDYPFRASYLQQLERHFGAKVGFSDFRGANLEPIRVEINRWVAEETHDKINNLIQPNVLTVDTRLVLLNALYFLGNWIQPFDPGATRQNDFHNFDGSIVKTDFMHSLGMFPYYSRQEFETLELPYMGGSFSLVVILPDENLPLSEFKRGFTAEDFAETRRDMQRVRVSVELPRFHISTQTNLNKILAELGMPEPFTQGADFSGMTGRKDLKIDHVVHHANLEVDEAGTEAAAATAVVIIQKALEIDEAPVKVFRANRPFLFALAENSTNTIIFLGVIRSL